jgi:dienelactone hydrolase
MKTTLLIAALSACLLATFANAQTASTRRASRLPPTRDYSAPGPFATISESQTGPDGTYTIVRPETLGKDGFKHAPIIFGPGIGGSMDSMMNLLQRIASHGFVIIGRQIDGGPRNPENNRRMTAGLDWLIEQNSTSGSIFANKLDVERAASMGYSVGGTGAVDIGGHKAIITVVSIHGHSAEAELHGTLLLLGGTNDIMRDGQSWLAPTYAASKVPTFFSLVKDANHGYPARVVDGVQSGVEAPAMIAWLRYWIYDDQGAKQYFFGDDCVMCKEPWTNTQRKHWP